MIKSTFKTGHEIAFQRRISSQLVPGLVGVLLALVFNVGTISSARANPGMDPWACTPSPSVFSENFLVADWEDVKKLSIKEFAYLPISPSGALELPKGTELNVVIDTACLLDPARGSVSLAWLMEVKEKLPPSQSGYGVRSFQWKLEQAIDFKQLQETFEQEPCVEMVSPERRYELNASYAQNFVDPYAQNQQHFSSLNYQAALPEFFLSLMIRRPVIIAVIDTGVDLNHDDLAPNRWINREEVSGNGKDDDGNGYIDDVNGFNFADNLGDAGPRGDWPNSGHGTHVAGLAAARLDNKLGGMGMNGLAKIMSLNVFLTSGHSQSSILENAIRYAGENNADVINMSVGGNEYSRTMRSALQYAVRRGSLIVAAAGNLSFEICDNPSAATFTAPAVYGGSINGMITVGSVDAVNGAFSLFSNYSNRLIQLVAPGAYHSQLKMGLLSTMPGQSYAYLQGTSMSAPIVSGAAALASAWLKAHGYESNGARLEKILTESARRDPQLVSYVENGQTLDILELVRYLKANYPPRN